MHLEWLEDILAIAQTGSFSGAAEKRHLTQSAFSRRIKQIEQHVGVELFDRRHKPVVLRATTLAQSEQIGQIAATLRQLVIDLRRGDRIVNNKIVIASQHSLTTSLTPAILQGIQRRGENTYVRLRSANLDECFALLVSRQADVAIFYRLPDEASGQGDDLLDTITIGSDRLIPVAAPDLAKDLATRRQATDMAYVAYPGDVFFGKVMERKILPHLAPTIAPVPMAETALTLAAIEMAAVGLAVAWVPRSLALDRIASGRLVDLSDALPSCDLQVKAARVQGATGRVEIGFWSQLLTLQSHP